MRNVRLVNRYGEDMQYCVEPGDDIKLARIREELAECIQLEPWAGWRLEGRGTGTIWHEFLRPPISRLRPTIPIGDELEPIPGGRIRFAGEHGSVLATIIAVWPSGVTLRRDDTGTIQFLARGDYTVEK